MHTIITNQCPKSNNINQLMFWKIYHTASKSVQLPIRYWLPYPKLINNTNLSPFLSWILSHLCFLSHFLYISNSNSKMWVFMSSECLSLLYILYYIVCVCLILIVCIIIIIILYNVICVNCEVCECVHGINII